MSRGDDSPPRSLVFEMEGARAAFTTRAVEGAGRGDGAAEAIVRDLAVSRVARLQQVHGDRVVLVADGTPMEAPAGAPVVFLGDGDALATSRRDLALAVVTADCVPLLLADRRGRAVAAVHAGWRGAAAGIALRAVEALARHWDVAAAEIDLLLGPAAGGCCYEVGDEVVAALEGIAPAGTPRDAWVRPGGRGRPHVDLRGLLRAQLAAAGIAPEAIRASSECTICAGDRWPSWRREGSGAGRIWAAVSLSTPGRA